MFIEQAHLFVALVMQSILVEYSVERSNVIIVRIAKWEFTAGDIDIVNFLLVCSVED